MFFPKNLRNEVTIFYIWLRISKKEFKALTCNTCQKIEYCVSLKNDGKSSYLPKVI